MVKSSYPKEVAEILDFYYPFSRNPANDGGHASGQKVGEDTWTKQRKSKSCDNS